MRALLWLVLVAAVAAGPGCGGKGKEIPAVIPDTPAAENPAAAVPAKSDPAAAAVVGRAVAAVTDGHPDRLDRAKTSRAMLKGEVIRPTGSTPTTRSIEGVWPDRLAVHDSSPDGSKFMLRLRRPVLWAAKQADGGTTPVEFGDMKAFEAMIAGDAVARHWLPTLVPLADPAAVVFDFKKQAANGRTADTIRAALPGRPVYTLWFDEKTHLLGRIDFTQVEPTRSGPTAKVYHFDQYKPFDGLTAPTKIEYHENGQLGEAWAAEAWTFPDRIDDAGFDPPR